MVDESETLLYMLYPTFIIHEERGLIPNLYLPINFKEDYIPRFNEKKKKEVVEKYSADLERVLHQTNLKTDIKLQWDKLTGLTNISLGIHGGLDLDLDDIPCFREHNLGIYNSFVGAAIAMKYISDLLKCKN